MCYVRGGCFFCVFLSTLSLRRATGKSSRRSVLYGISIHALLAESDMVYYSCKQEILYFYPRSPCGERPTDAINGCNSDIISIHALLAESDILAGLWVLSTLIFLSTLSLRRATCVYWFSLGMKLYFYPRSPCGERRKIRLVAPHISSISIHALLAESDARNTSIAGRITLFLSTLSLRRATVAPVLAVGRARYFYPRSPCGERQPLWPSD